MYPVIRFYLEERPDVGALHARVASIKESSPTDSIVQLFPDKRNNFSFHVVRDSTGLRLCDLLVGKHHEVDRYDVSMLLGENAYLDVATRKGVALPSWFSQKLERERGMLRLDKTLYDSYLSSLSAERDALTFLLDEAGIPNVAEVLRYTKGEARYVAELSLSTRMPVVDAFTIAAHVSRGLLRYGGLLSVDDPLHRSYAGQEFFWEEHFDAHLLVHREARHEANKERLLRSNWTN